MGRSYIIFLVRLVLFSVVVYFLFSYLSGSLPPKFYYPHTLYLIAFFFITTAVFHYGALRSASKGGRSTVSYFMMATAAKFFIYLLVMGAYAVMKTAGVAAFISNFFAMYVLMTVFEVSVIYSYFKSMPVQTGTKPEKNP